ncbi:MAG: hypothetical protein IPN68_17840 [Bacteroidetes bacterium]|nr:hypothetical protein [Bacteroidota bacterium]
MKTAMSINVMLHEFKLATEPQFIQYVRSTGKERGTVKTGYYLYGSNGSKLLESSGKFETFRKFKSGRALMKHTGLMPVWNTEKRQRETLFVPNIVGYGNYLVRH